MARIRTIKPEFPQSESMGRVSRDARLLFIMLWTLCDDSGRARANSRMLASLLFPYDEDASGHMEGWLKELEHEKCIVRYENGADKYIAVTKWSDHQKIDKPSKSRFPEPPILAKKSRSPSKPREPSALDQGPKEGIKDQGGQGPGFEDFWNAYPKKVKRGTAFLAWTKAAKQDDPKIIIAAACAFASSRAGQDEKFTPHPTTWLNSQSWLDEGLTPSGPLPTPEEIEAARDKADKYFKRGKYAVSMQGPLSANPQSRKETT